MLEKKEKKEWIDDYSWKEGFKGLWSLVILVSYWIWYIATIIFKISWSIIKSIGEMFEKHSKEQDKKYKREMKKGGKY